MGTSFLETDCQTVYRIDFEEFYCLYNSDSGASEYIKNEDECYEYEICIKNNFFRKPRTPSTPFAVRLCLNPTSACNLRCEYCFSPKETIRKTSKELAIEFLHRFISLFPDAPKFYVDLSGSGEPLLALPFVTAIADECLRLSNQIRKEIVPMLACNGTLLSEAIASYLRAHRILFGVSLDGYKECHDSQRPDAKGEGTWDKIIANIKSIKDRSLIGGAMTFSKSDTDIFKSYETMLDLFETVSIRPVRMGFSTFDFSYIEKGYEQFTDLLIDEGLHDGITKLKRILNGDDMFGRYIKKAAVEGWVSRRCDAGISRFALGTDGKIYGCSPATTTDAYIWPDSKIESHKPHFNNSEHMRTQGCDRCLVKNFCGGDCPLVVINGWHSEQECDFKRFLFIQAERLLGTLWLFKPKVYSRIVSFVDEVLERDLPDAKLVWLAKYRTDIPFIEILKMRDHDKTSYTNLLTESGFPG